MKQNNLIAVTIFLGFVLVAGAYFYTNNQTAVAVIGSDVEGQLAVKRAGDSAWTYGNKNAPTFIVEFSDFECPFCSRVHPTIKKIVDESNGTIAWQFRHLPLPNHRNAETAAVISECVGSNAGNEAFWQFADKVFEARDVSLDFLRETAKGLGVTDSTIDSCLDDDVIKERIVVDQATARALGGNGTPYSVILKSDNSVTPVSGALPYENWISLLKE